MRRTALLMVFAVLIGGVTTAAPASAEPGDNGARRPRPGATGTFEGTGTYEHLAECGIAREVVAGTYDATGRRFDDGTFSWDVCVDFATNTEYLFTATGTFVVTTDSRATLTGTVSGFIGSFDLSSMPVDLVLEVTGSTGTPRPVTGTISLTGDRSEPALYTSLVGGTFSADLRWRR